MNGAKINNRRAKEMLEQINLGESDSAVISLMIGGAGLNCQRMNAVIHMAPCFQAAMERQANGTSWENHLLTIGRIFRYGQTDPEASTATIMAPKEDIDAVPLARKEKNLTEAEAIMYIEEEMKEGSSKVIDWGKCKER